MCVSFVKDEGGAVTVQECCRLPGSSPDEMVVVDVYFQQDDGTGTRVTYQQIEISLDRQMDASLAGCKPAG